MPTLAELRAAQGAGGTSPAPDPLREAFAQIKRPSQDTYEGQGALATVLDWTSRPQRALVGGIRGAYKDDLGVLEGIRQGFTGESQAGFKDILNDAGVEGKAATYAGGVLDLVVDPLNFVPIAKIAKYAGSGLKTIPGVAKVTKKVMSTRVPRMFNAYSGLDPEVSKAVRLAQAESRTTADRVIEDLMKIPGKKDGTSKLDETDLDTLKKLIGEERDTNRTAAIRNFNHNPLKPVTPEMSAEFLKNLNQAGEAVRLPRLAQTFDSKWKELATVWNPRFHVNNVIGNTWNMAINNPDQLTLKNNPLTAYWKGNQFIRRMNAGTLSRSEQQLAEQLKRFGVDTGLTQHINYDPNDIERIRDSARNIQGKTRNPYTHVSRFLGKIGDRSERAAKIGTVLQELGKEKSLEDAIIHTKDTLFDYQELTPEMRLLRDTVAPFLTFKLKNTALQPKGLLKHPEMFAAVGKTRQNLEREAKTEGTYVPDSERYPADVLNQITSTPWRTKTGDPISLRNPIPMGDLNIFSALIPNTRAGDQSRRALFADTAGPLPQIALKAANVDIRRPGNIPQPPEGLFGDVPANDLIQALVPNSMNTHRSRSKPGKTEVRMPWLVDEALRQGFPLSNSLGRTLLSYSDPEAANDPLAWLSWLGVPVASTTRDSRRRNKAGNRKEYNTMVNSLRKKDRERVK